MAQSEIHTSVPDSEIRGSKKHVFNTFTARIGKEAITVLTDFFSPFRRQLDQTMLSGPFRCINTVFHSTAMSWLIEQHNVGECSGVLHQLGQLVLSGEPLSHPPPPLTPVPNGTRSSKSFTVATCLYWVIPRKHPNLLALGDQPLGILDTPKVPFICKRRRWDSDTASQKICHCQNVKPRHIHYCELEATAGEEALPRNNLWSALHPFISTKESSSRLDAFPSHSQSFRWFLGEWECDSFLREEVGVGTTHKGTTKALLTGHKLLKMKIRQIRLQRSLSDISFQHFATPRSVYN